MPELPDIALYLDALASRVVGKQLERLRIASPFLLRTADPPVADLVGRAIRDVRRLGKRIVLALEDDYFVVLHLMRSEEHRSELQSLTNLVCRLLLEKKKQQLIPTPSHQQECSV